MSSSFTNDMEPFPMFMTGTSDSLQTSNNFFTPPDPVWNDPSMEILLGLKSDLPEFQGEFSPPGQQWPMPMYPAMEHHTWNEGLNTVGPGPSLHLDAAGQFPEWEQQCRQERFSSPILTNGIQTGLAFSGVAGHGEGEGFHMEPHQWLNGSPSHGLAANQNSTKNYHGMQDVPLHSVNSPVHATNMAMWSAGPPGEQMHAPVERGQTPPLLPPFLVPTQVSEGKNRQEPVCEQQSTYMEDPALSESTPVATAPLAQADLTSLIRRIKTGHWHGPCQFLKRTEKFCEFGRPNKDNGSVVTTAMQDSHFIVCHILSEAKLWQVVGFNPEKLKRRHRPWVICDPQMAMRAAEFLVYCPVPGCETASLAYTRRDSVALHIQLKHMKDGGADYLELLNKKSRHQQGDPRFYKDTKVLLREVVMAALWRMASANV